MTKAVIVFSGYNQRGVVSFLRTLEKFDVRYGIVANSEEDSIFLTDYKSRVLATRTKRALDLDDMLSCLQQACNEMDTDELLIAPSTEALNRFLLGNRIAFESNRYIVPIVDKELYEDISDKQPFGKLCSLNGIDVPESFNDLANAGLPAVAKPKKYQTRSGETPPPVLLFNKDDIKDFLSKHEPGDFYYQSYIDGSSYYLLYYVYGNGKIEKFSQINLMQQPNGKHIVAAMAADFHNSEESSKYENLFKKIGYRGLVMVEIKQSHNIHYMIEANPRFWGPSQLFIDAGVNLFEAFLDDQKIIDRVSDTTDYSKETRYFWFGGYLEAANSDKGVTYHDYSASQYDSDKDKWLLADVYNREGTKGIFESEVSKYHDH